MNGGHLAASSWSSAAGKANPSHPFKHFLNRIITFFLLFMGKLSMQVYCHPNSKSILRKLIKAKNKHFHPLSSLFFPQRRITVCSAMENRKQHLLISKLSWHSQTGHVLLGTGRLQHFWAGSSMDHWLFPQIPLFTVPGPRKQLCKSCSWRI